MYKQVNNENEIEINTDAFTDSGSVAARKKASKFRESGIQEFFYSWVLRNQNTISKINRENQRKEKNFH